MRGKKSPLTVTKTRQANALNDLEPGYLKALEKRKVALIQKKWEESSDPATRRRMLEELSRGKHDAPFLLWEISLESLSNDTQTIHWYKCAKKSTKPVGKYIWDQFALKIIKDLLRPAASGKQTRQAALNGEKYLRWICRDDLPISGDNMLTMMQLLCQIEKSHFNRIDKETTVDLVITAMKWKVMDKQQQKELVVSIAHTAPEVSKQRWIGMAKANLDKLSDAEIDAIMSQNG